MIALSHTLACSCMHSAHHYHIYVVNIAVLCVLQEFDDPRDHWRGRNYMDLGEQRDDDHTLLRDRYYWNVCPSYFSDSPFGHEYLYRNGHTSYAPSRYPSWKSPLDMINPYNHMVNHLGSICIISGQRSSSIHPIIQLPSYLFAAFSFRLDILLFVWYLSLFDFDFFHYYLRALWKLILILRAVPPK